MEASILSNGISGNSGAVSSITTSQNTTVIQQLAPSPAGSDNTQVAISNVQNTSDNTLIYELYQAAFKRMPDNNGFIYWVDQHSKGLSINTISSLFLASDEFEHNYSNNLTNAQLVDLLYKNILGREGDTGGVKFWTDLLNTGQATKETVLIGFAGSPENVANTASHVDNGYWVV